MQPLLCADIGNSHTTVGLVRGGEVLAHWRVATEERRTSDEWGVLLRALLPAGDLAGVAGCSSGPAGLHAGGQMAAGALPRIPPRGGGAGARAGPPGPGAGAGPRPASSSDSMSARARGRRSSTIVAAAAVRSG